MNVIHWAVWTQDTNDDEFSSFTAFLEDVKHETEGYTSHCAIQNLQ